MSALIHKMSSSVPLPKFDLFGIPPTQNQIERDIVTEHRPITTINPSSFVQFEIQTAADEYIDLEKLFLYMKVRIGSVAVEDWEDISPINYVLHTHIKQLDIFIGDKQVTTSSPFYAYKAYLEAKLGMPKTEKESYLELAGWYTADLNSGHSINTAENDDFRDFATRDYFGKLHTDLSFQGRSLLGGCKLIIRILFNDPKFYMMSLKHAPEFVFLEYSLYVHRAKVSQALVDAHEAALKISTAKYPITLTNVKAFTIMAGSNDANIDNIHSGQIPRRIFVFFVDNKGVNGSYDLNPFHFVNCNISSLAVFVDGVQYPPKPYAPNFSLIGGTYARELMSIYEALDQTDGETTCEINREYFRQGNTILGFNFAPDLTAGSGITGYINPIRLGTIRLHVRFSQPLEKTYSVLVYFEFDKILEIDINRNAFIDLF
jgi:hypothetical protein